MMPTHLQYIRCGSRFYTAAGCRFGSNHTCQTCGGRLADPLPALRGPWSTPRSCGVVGRGRHDLPGFGKDVITLF